MLPFDRRITSTAVLIGIRNCAWNASAYCYATLPGVGDIDLGMESNLVSAKESCPDARRVIMYSTVELANKPLSEIRCDLELLTHDYAPCDIVFADIESSTPDDRVM